MTSGTLQDSGRRIARAQRLEERCFEVLGGFVTSTADAEVKLLLARQSHHHAWHAELFARVLPDANGFDPGPVDPDPGVVAFLDLLAATTGPIDRLAGVFDLWIPRKVAAYERWLDETDPVRDAPLVRWLQFVVADERADLAEGRALLAARAPGAPTPGRVALAAALDRVGDLLD